MPSTIVHLGLGNFFRAHQAWYTSAAPDAADWTIAAFTGRSPAAATALCAQGNRYTMLTRGPESDQAQIIGTVRQAYAGDDLDRWRTHLAAPRTALLTLTVTEKGYHRRPGGGLDDADPQVRDDVTRWLHGEDVCTVPGRLMAGLAERRIYGGGPISIVSCDNLPDNGAATARVVLDFAELAEPALVPWINDHVSFVTTMVDRITPRTTAADLAVAAALTGFDDRIPVVTEPFTEWVLGGAFPAGRPDWAAAGARFVTDVKPYEQRKLVLLNGGHSLLAYAGSARGHQTVADAVADPPCLSWLNQWWDEARWYVPLPRDEIAAYRAALLRRFANTRIRHTLAQIAADGSQKIPIRLLPVLRAERAAGRMPPGAVRLLAAWIAHLRGAGAPVDDAGAGPFMERARRARDVIAHLAPDLATDEALLNAVETILEG